MVKWSYPDIASFITHFQIVDGYVHVHKRDLVENSLLKSSPEWHVGHFHLLFNYIFFTNAGGGVVELTTNYI